MNQQTVTENLEPAHFRCHWNFEGCFHQNDLIESRHCVSVDASTRGVALLPRGNSELGRRAIERQAYLLTRMQGVGFEQILDHNLDASEPYVILPAREGRTLAEWILNWSQPPPQLQLFRLASTIMSAIANLHAMGYVHSQLSSEHLLVVPKHGEFDSKIVGLSRSVPVGECLAGSSEEACTSSDIPQAMSLLAEFLSPTFLATPLASAMKAPDPADRPSARQVADLFLDLAEQSKRQWLRGASANPVNPAAGRRAA